MASTNFKLFDENKKNMMSDIEYNINTQRLNGVQAGIASSRLQNKTLYQTSLVAYSLAQIMIQNGYYANDSAAVSAFVGNMSNSLLQKVLDKATTTEAQNGVNNTKWMTPALTKAAIDILAAKSQNILSDSTKTLYGLGSSAVPNDVLAELGKYKQYWWARRSLQYTEERTSVGSKVFIFHNYGITLKVANSISINQNSSEITLDNPEDFNISIYNTSNEFRNRLQELLNKAPCYVTGLENNEATIYYLPDNGSLSYSTDDDTTSYTVCFYYKNSTTNRAWFGTTSDVKAQAVSPKAVIGPWQYVKSSNRNDYPDSGTQDGYEYEYLGIPLDNAVAASSIETGSYVGDGTTLRTVELGFTPRAVYVTDARGAAFRYSGGVGRFCGGLAMRDKPAKDGGRTILAICDNGFRVNKDTSTSPYVVTNYDGDEYYYLALR